MTTTKASPVGKVTVHRAEPCTDREAGFLAFEAETPHGLLELRSAHILQDGSLEDPDWRLGGEEIEAMDEYPAPDFRRRDFGRPEKLAERVSEAVEEWLEFYEEWTSEGP